MKGDNHHDEREEQRSSANETWHLVTDPADEYDARDEFRRTS